MMRKDHKKGIFGYSFLTNCTSSLLFDKADSLFVAIPGRRSFKLFIVAAKANEVGFIAGLNDKPFNSRANPWFCSFIKAL